MRVSKVWANILYWNVKRDKNLLEPPFLHIYFRIGGPVSTWLISDEMTFEVVAQCELSGVKSITCLQVFI